MHLRMFFELRSLRSSVEKGLHLLNLLTGLPVADSAGAFRLESRTDSLPIGGVVRGCLHDFRFGLQNARYPHGPLAVPEYSYENQPIRRTASDQRVGCAV